MNTTEGKDIANRFREVMLNGRWIANTNYMDQVTSVSWEQARQKVGDLNTIGLLTAHVNYYIDGILNVFNGGGLEIRDKYSFDFEPITSQSQWEERIENLRNNSERFANHVEQMSTDALNAGFVDEKYGTYRRNIEAMIEHAYYHLGQISLIKKMTQADIQPK